MKQSFTLISDSELLSKLEQPLEELKSGMRDLQVEVRKKTMVKYYTISEICDILHVSRSSIYRYIKDGLLIAHKAGRRVLISETSIRKVLKPINNTKKITIQIIMCNT